MKDIFKPLGKSFKRGTNAKFKYESEEDEDDEEEFLETKKSVRPMRASAVAKRGGKGQALRGAKRGRK